MRTTVTIDDDVYEAATHLAKASGERLGKVLSLLARRGLTRTAEGGRQASGRFPTFKTAPGAPVISASRVQKAIDEEGGF